MPKVRQPGGPVRAGAAEIKAMDNRISDRFGAMLLTTAQLGQVIGIQNYDRISQWAQDEDLHPVFVGRRRKWATYDVARALCNAKLRGCR